MAGIKLTDEERVFKDCIDRFPPIERTTKKEHKINKNNFPDVCLELFELAVHYNHKIDAVQRIYNRLRIGDVENKNTNFPWIYNFAKTSIVKLCEDRDQKTDMSTTNGK